ncbi:MAG: RagB/SusD family nutrient uptake outer membrane protein [Cyclobacteriaceae bacterium]
MKKIIYISFIVTFLSGSCNDVLDVAPQGALDFSALSNEDGIFGLLVAAYSALDGKVADNEVTGRAWRSAASNWVYGDVASDDAYKGTDFGDQLPINDIERLEPNAANEYFNTKWRVVYDGISRSNDVLRALAITEGLDAGFVTTVTAEVRFLRGWYHLEAKKMWNMVPYIDEAVEDFNRANDQDIWPDIEADLEFAVANLPVVQDQVGRATRGAAQAVLAKAHMFQEDFAAAKPLIDDLIANPMYQLLDNYGALFRAATDNNTEAIFTVQNSVNDGAADGDGSINGNIGNVLNFPHSGSPFGCCGFHQPSFNLVNAFQTDGTGLPLIDNFNDQDVTNDMGVATTAPFSEHTGPLDPRLDFTVGRRGIPYLGWGDHEGQSWIRDQAFGGPYSPKKQVFSAEESGTASSTSGWTSNTTAINQPLIRLADVILWRAEIYVEDGQLDMARQLVNQIRARARDSAPVTESNGNTPAANYAIDEYPASHPAFASEEEAKKAVRFERRLELAMEGHRYFDLVRWGIAEEVMNRFFMEESVADKKPFYVGAKFTPNKNEYYPIPLNQIVDSSVGGNPTLIQNPGY